VAVGAGAAVCIEAEPCGVIGGIILGGGILYQIWKGTHSQPTIEASSPQERRLLDWVAKAFCVDRKALGNYNDSSHDDLGRSIFPVVSKSADGNTTYYDVLTAYGKTERYSVTTESIPLNTHFLSDSVGSDFQGNITVVQSIGLPDGSSYTFSYESLYGELSGITLPNQGVVSYIYQGFVVRRNNHHRVRIR